MISSRIFRALLIVISIITLATAPNALAQSSDTTTSPTPTKQTPTDAAPQPDTSATPQPESPQVWEYFILALSPLLFIAVTIITLRHPRALDQHGRPAALSLLAAIPVLGWYFFAIPLFFSPIWQIINQNQPADFPTTAAGNATLQWLAHMISLPILFLWWWGQKNDQQRAATPTDFLLATDLHTHHQENHRANRPPRTRLLSTLLAVPVFIAAILSVILTNLTAAALKEWYTGIKPDALAHQTLTLLKENDLDPAAILIILSVILAAPLIEEFIYRGTLQAYLRNLTGSTLAAILISSTIFTSMHLSVANPEALPGLFVLAVFMGTAYAYTGRLITPILIHSLFNLTNIALLYWSIANSTV